MKKRTKTQDREREILALKLVKNLGKRGISRLLDRFGDPAAIFQSSQRELERMGMQRRVSENIAGFDRWDEVDRILKQGERAGSHLLSRMDPEFPPLLKEIYDPPPLLWIKGDPTILSSPSLAIVGTRVPNQYGRDQAERWSRWVAAAGLTVVSGFAKGIDTVAHETTLKMGGHTVAVLGSGIDHIYPRENRKYVDEVINSGGAVITEFPPGTPPERYNFPVRNRVVSGLSLGVLVVQTGKSGGSMITAESAMDQNREVFVIPHSLHNRKGEGNNYLIKTSQGKLVQTLEDLLDEIPYTPAASDFPEEPSLSLQTLSQDQKAILSCLKDGEASIRSLSKHTGQRASSLLPMLLELELKGVVRQNGGRVFELHPAVKVR